MLDAIAFINSQRRMREQFEMPRNLAPAEPSPTAAAVPPWRSRLATRLRVFADWLEPVSATSSDAQALRWSLNTQ